jgi:hypothetical protein
VSESTKQLACCIQCLGAGFTESGYGSKHFAPSGSGSRLLLKPVPIWTQTQVFMTENLVWIKNRHIYLLRHVQRTFSIQEKPPAQQKFLHFPPFLWTILAGSGSTDPFEFGFNPHPKHWLHHKSTRIYFFRILRQFGFSLFLFWNIQRIDMKLEIRKLNF